ncbi:hypothetical protein [Hymenobacter sp. YC55]|uniref:hypothetical protein n=1 Tax=Hymenobacter sp. YC55 TaxID=3034019 RepID=UPI0023F6A1FE|nr:hypothetical protein [Hymenobacter sp. YC55]MDF7815125.1 hypothetical protein [Hymenobacter sp. YC55]
MITDQLQRPVAEGIFAKAYRIIRKAYDKQIDGTGLALFRIVFSAVLLGEVVNLFYFRELIFDAVPFIEPSEMSFAGPLVLWMGAVVLLLLGWFTRAAAIANYVFVLLFFSSVRTYVYMMTPVYVSISFLFLFLPIGQCLSWDRVWRTVRTGTLSPPPRTVSQLAYYVPVIVGIAFVYFDSTLYKLTAPLWLKGLGMWKPMSSPFEMGSNGTFILNQEGLVKFLGYLTLVFEFFFLFLFPFRKFRAGLMVIGIGLHVGVLLFFNLPFFALGFGSIYLLMVPVSYWRRWFKARPDRGLAAWLLRRPRLRRLIEASSHRPASSTPRGAVDQAATTQYADASAGTALRKLKLAGLTTGIVGLTLMQGAVSYNSTLAQVLREKSGFDHTLVGQGLARLTMASTVPSRKFLGITNHPIALDEHFAGYTRIVAVTYVGADSVERFLPIIRPDGQPGAYLYGVLWLKWTYDIVTKKIDQARLEKGIRTFTAFWATKNHVDLNHCQFKVKVKKIREATEWEPDFLEKQRAAPWIEAGVVRWENQQFTAQLADIPTL